MRRAYGECTSKRRSTSHVHLLTSVLVKDRSALRGAFHEFSRSSEDSGSGQSLGMRVFGRC